MKKLLIIIFVVVAQLGFGQTGFLLDTSQVIFKLKIESVKEVDSDKVLGNVNLKIYGTDSTLREFISDNLGVFPLIEIKQNTSYSIVVSKEGYYIAKGKETSIGHNKSKLFVHEYKLQQLENISCFPLLPGLTYNENGISPTNYSEDIFLPLYNIMNENPNIIIQITGYRSKSEKKKVSNKRAEFYSNKLISLGLDKKRLKIMDGGYVGDSEKNIFLTAKIIRTDYKQK